MPEIGTLDGKAVAKLAGLAPLARDSGRVEGRRPIRAGVRSILFFVAEIVSRRESDFAAFHAKLRHAGKPKKVIRIALARNASSDSTQKHAPLDPNYKLQLDPPDSGSPFK